MTAHVHGLVLTIQFKKWRRSYIYHLVNRYEKVYNDLLASCLKEWLYNHGGFGGHFLYEGIYRRATGMDLNFLAFQYDWVVNFPFQYINK